MVETKNIIKGLKEITGSIFHTIILLIMLLLVVVVLVDLSRLESKCIDLGFDTIDMLTHECVKDIGYDKFKGTNKFCFMPIEKKQKAALWCAE